MWRWSGELSQALWSTGWGRLRVQGLGYLVTRRACAATWRVSLMIGLLVAVGCGGEAGSRGTLPTLSVQDVSTMEGDSGETQAEFVLQLDAASATEVRVSYATEGGSAQQGRDYRSTLGQVILPPGELMASVFVPVLGDTIFEPDETLVLRLSQPQGVTLASEMATLTIQNDDALVIRVEDAQLQEGLSGTQLDLLFPVTLSAAADEELRVEFQTEDGSATEADADYLGKTGTLVFPANTKRQSVVVTVMGDDRYEGDEQLHVRLLGVSQSSDQLSLGRDLATGTILNDDDPPLLSVQGESFSEADCQSSSLDFLLTLDTPSGLPLSVDYRTQDGSASVADGDYTASTGTLTLPAGDSAGVVSVQVGCDLKNESDESFSLVLSNPVNVRLLIQEATAFILNDDSPPQLSVADASVMEGDSGLSLLRFPLVLSHPLPADEQVSFVLTDGSARVSDDDYLNSAGSVIIPAGEVSASIDVQVQGDRWYEADEDLSLVLSPSAAVKRGRFTATGTILNDDPMPALSIDDPSVLEGDVQAGTLRFSLSLSAVSKLPVSVDYMSVDGSATATDADYSPLSGTLVIPAGSSGATISLSVLPDTRYEADETLELQLTSTTGASLADTSGLGTILNDDSMPQLSVGDAQAPEGAAGSTGSMVFMVTLSAPSGEEVQLNYATVDGSATSSSGDFDASSGTLVIPAGSAGASLVVMLHGDDLYEPDQDFGLQLSKLVGASAGRLLAQGTILNDDAMPSLTVDSPSVQEAETSLSFKISLSGIAGVDVIASYSTFDGTASAAAGDYSPLSGQLVIPAGQNSVLLPVQIHDDALFELDEDFSLQLTSPVHASLAVAAGQGTILDQDPMPALSVADASILEGDTGLSSMSFPVTLSALAGVGVSVDFGTADQSALAGLDYLPATGTVTVPAGVLGAQIVVSVLGDTIHEPEETLRVTLANPLHASVAVGQATGHILDDDPLPGISVDDPQVLEGPSGVQTALVFTLSLSNPSSSPLQVNYGSLDGSASSAGGDYLPVGGTLVFAPGETVKTLGVTVLGDDRYELDETLSLLLSMPVGVQLVKASGSGSILNDDPVLILVDPSATGSDGLTWPTAYPDLQQGVDAAAAAAGSGGSATVWVAAAAGGYQNGGGTGTVLVLRAGISVYGGFTGYAGGSGVQETSLAARDWLAHPTVLDGKGSAYHVVEAADNARLDGFTVTGGNAVGTAASRKEGGGLWNSGHPGMRVENCLFDTNFAAIGGGAIFNGFSTGMQILSCHFTGNSGTVGAALYNYHATGVVVRDSRFSGNQASVNDGGAIQSSDSASLTILDSILIANQASSGGAIGSQNSDLIVERSRFLGNIATDTIGGRGGALSLWGSGNVSISSSLFSGNTAVLAGGALSLRSNAQASLNNCSLSQNSAPKGGAIYTNNASVGARNLVVWGNIASQGPSIWNEAVFALSTWDYSDVESCGGSAAWSGACGWSNGGDLDLDPLFTDALGPDGLAGSEDDDLSLAAASPCRDAANGDLAPPLDLLKRAPHDDPLVVDTGTGSPGYVDMGALEAQ